MEQKHIFTGVDSTIHTQLPYTFVVMAFTYWVRAGNIKEDVAHYTFLLHKSLWVRVASNYSPFLQRICEDMKMTAVIEWEGSTRRTYSKATGHDEHITPHPWFVSTYATISAHYAALPPVPPPQ
jgi:hypothetical protein